MFYTIYQTTNTVNGKVYVGKHLTKDPNDDYLGSGKMLKAALKKYGRDKFTKEVLHVFETEEEMNLKEKELVTEEFCARKDTYNICEGGKGGFGWINRNVDLTEAKRRSALTTNTKYDLETRSSWSVAAGTASIRKHGLRPAFHEAAKTAFMGKVHTPETKEKIGATNRLRQSGVSNSQYGTVWITDGVTNKKISASDTIPSGWIRGRKFNRGSSKPGR